MVAGISVVVWLQVVGQVTHQVLHHVIHALPVVAILIAPKNRWVRLTRVLTGLLWVFMLSVITDMVHHAIIEAGLWNERGMFVWMAPVLAALCAVWVALNLTLLSETVRRLPFFMVSSLALIPIFAAAQPVVSEMFTVPVERVVQGKSAWTIVLIIELVVLTAIPWHLAVRSTKRRDFRSSRRVRIWLAAYWSLFLACMIVGLLPVVNP